MKRKCQRRVWFRYLKSLFETFSDLSRLNAEVLHSLFFTSKYMGVVCMYVYVLCMGAADTSLIFDLL